MSTEIHIHADAGRLNFPLRTIWQGALSSAVCVVHGVPDDIESLGVVFCVAPTGTTPHDPPTYRAVAAKQADGSWRAYCTPFTFPTVGLALQYSLVGTDAQENPRWLGTGQLNVVDCPAQGSSDAPEILPRDTHVYSPTDGLYHKVLVSFDEDGFPHFEVERQGVSR